MKGFDDGLGKVCVLVDNVVFLRFYFICKVDNVISGVVVG